MTENSGGKGSAPRPFSVDQKTFSDNWDLIFGSKSKTAGKPDCYCYNCNKNYTEPGSHFPYIMTRMIVCPMCGNKRCPHATDHSFACTNSNNPGQPGSRY